jgi:glutathione synthase/RimK-type ligase-like ATP-grasp enzyme
MTTIAILTPDPSDEAFHTRWREVLDRLTGHLRDTGIAAEAHSWVEPGLDSFDLVLPLLAWGYHRAGAGWAAQVERWESDGVRLLNPPSVLRWNADKAYIGRLAEAGAPVAPTLFTDRLSVAALEDAAARFGTDRLIAKPRVSAGAWQTIRWSPGAPIEDGPTGPAMIQPYLPAIEEEGEISLIYLGDAFSHAIRKRPQAGDFRVQPEYDGIITPHVPAADELEAAERILSTVEEELLYARIDLVRDGAGQPVLMELELVEPDLYLGYDEQAGMRFADAVRRAQLLAGDSLAP